MVNALVDKPPVVPKTEAGNCCLHWIYNHELGSFQLDWICQHRLVALHAVAVVTAHVDTAPAMVVSYRAGFRYRRLRAGES